MTLGEFEEGWRLYEWRWRTEEQEKIVDIDAYNRSLWLGDKNVSNKVILVQAEQGFGDFIQFVRYIPMIEALGADVIVETLTPLVPLVSTLKGSFKIAPKGERLPHFDWRCPIMSLPLAFKTVLETVPGGVPYLSPELQKDNEWRERLGPRIKPRIGLVWSGTPHHINDHNRSIALRALKPMLDQDFEFHSLQKDIRAVDREFLESSMIHCHENELHDFSDTAGLIAALDLVISVDTSVAHLAGALAKPVWIMLPYVPDFRCLLDRDDSPWFPTARLFRQDRPGDWAGVIDRVVSRLKQMNVT